MKKILICGSNSYLGVKVQIFLNSNYDEYEIDVLDMRNPNWENHGFFKYDTVFFVAGIAHDFRRKKNSKLYYSINTDLPLKAAIISRNQGVKQFIFMSSILIYNNSKNVKITKKTIPKSKGIYAKSKLIADISLQSLNSQNFKIAICRPPMIYGPDSKGNFSKIKNFALKTKMFVEYKNRRSMLFIDHFSNFIKMLIDTGEGGIFYPQDADYHSTDEIIKIISLSSGKKIYFIKHLGLVISIFCRIFIIFKKVFGDLYYDLDLIPFSGDYLLNSNYDCIKKSI